MKQYVFNEKEMRNIQMYLLMVLQLSKKAFDLNLEHYSPVEQDEYKLCVKMLKNYLELNDDDKS